MIDNDQLRIQKETLFVTKTFMWKQTSIGLVVWAYFLPLIICSVVTYSFSCNERETILKLTFSRVLLLLL